MNEERRAELRQGCAVADMNDNLVVLASDELRGLLDAADRVAALEAEVKRFATLMVVPHRDSSETGATPESLKAYIDELQGEWDDAEKRISEFMALAESRRGYIASLEAERERHRAIYAACLDDRSALSQRVATLEADLAALKADRCPKCGMGPMTPISESEAKYCSNCINQASAEEEANGLNEWKQVADELAAELAALKGASQ